MFERVLSPASTNLSFASAPWTALWWCLHSLLRATKLQVHFQLWVFLCLCGIFMFLQTLQFPPTDPSRAHWVDGRLNGSPLSASERVCALWRRWNLCRNLTFGWRVPLFDINSTDGGTYCFIWLFPAANKVAWFLKKNKFKQRKTRSWNLLHINKPNSFCNPHLITC